jgi:TetR/AcrR family transcriptional regulator, transcriptional repressor for nem operon
MGRTKEFDAEEALYKALKLFRSKGFNGSSMQEIVECTGLSRSSIYDTFGDKRELFIRSLKKYKDEITGNLIKLVAESTDIKATLKEILTFCVEMSLSKNTENNCIITNTTLEMAGFDSDIAGIVHNNMLELEQALAGTIRRHQALNLVADRHTPETLAKFIFTSISGIRVAGRSGADRASLEAVIGVVLGVM